MLDADQLAALECQGNRVVLAGPGAGKTHTLVEMIAKELDGLPFYQGIIACSYTNKACDELKSRCESRGLPTSPSFFGTLHSFCINQLINPFGWRLGERVDHYDILPRGGVPHGLSDGKRRDYLVSRLRGGSFSFNECADLALLIIDEIPEASDYLTSRYVAVMVDEYQDTDISFHRLFLRLVALGLRGTAIGDADQSIYGYQDKDPRHLIELEDSDEFETFRLSVNYRCNPAIKAYADVLIGASGIMHEIPDKPVRHVTVNGGIHKALANIAGVIPRAMERYGVDAPGKVALLARTNDDCKLASECLERRAVRTRLHERNSPLEDSTSLHRALMRDAIVSFLDPNSYEVDVLDKWLGCDAPESTRTHWYARLRSAFSQVGDDLIVDAPTIREFSERCIGRRCPEEDYDALLREVADVEAMVRHYSPPSSDEVQVMTYHKAKGLEFDLVFCLGCREGEFPHWKSRDPEALRQDRNLLYVGITRARKACFLICDDGQVGEPRPSPFIAGNPLLVQMQEDIRW